MWALLAATSCGHVPTYGGSVENCFKPPHHHDTSQVIYLKGSGGLEIHIESPTVPFNISGQEVIDVDAVFRDEVDPTTYSLYIGCGGCVASQDPIVIDPVPFTGYDTGVVEPFTQTRYFSLFKKEDRKYDTSLLANCAEEHFTIRLVDHMNRTGGPVFWGAVVGLGESFTAQELLEFPLYIQRNHGDTWNELGWTWWFTLFVATPILIALARAALSAAGARPLEVPMPGLEWEGRSVPTVILRVAPREYLYDLAILGFAWAMVEQFIHLCYAQTGLPMDYAFWVGLLLIIGLANGLGVLVAVLAWRGFRDPQSCLASPWWAPVQVAAGVGLLFLLGSGFYIGPSALILAGLLRFADFGDMRGRARTVPAPSGIKPAFLTVPVKTASYQRLPTALNMRM